MKKRMTLPILLIISIILLLSSCQLNEDNKILEITDNINGKIKEGDSYDTLDEVSLYIYEYERLPNNYITKKEALELGWKADKGNLWDVTDKKSIGGDRFGNREELLPKGRDRQYYECDINYEGGFRGPERIVYSNDGLIYYTKDHYKTFRLIYGDE